MDVEVIGIAPHMHYLGTKMQVVAESPDGKTVPLIWIKDWNFNWQSQYQYQTPIKLAKGLVIKLEAEYDNSSDNPSNPSKPPKRVHWGEQTIRRDVSVGRPGRHRPIWQTCEIAAMRGNRLGAVLVGGVASEEARKGMGPAALARLATEGFLIPERFKAALPRFDLNGNGKLTRQEIDAMPQNLRERI